MSARNRPPRAAPAVRARGALAAVALACAAAIVAGPQPLRAQSPAEYEIKAAFLYNFAKFVQWPASTLAPQAPLTVCVIGSDPFGAALDTVDRKVAQGHELQVRRRARLEEARSCHILFVAESERAAVPAILHAVQGAGVLTVSDIDRFAEAGGIIGLSDVDNKVQFSINLDRAHDDLLQINSQLLKLAKIVGRSAREDSR